jgi:hypothetical protein
MIFVSSLHETTICFRDDKFGGCVGTEREALSWNLTIAVFRRIRRMNAAQWWGREMDHGRWCGRKEVMEHASDEDGNLSESGVVCFL